MAELVGLRQKTYAFLIDDGNSDKAKRTKKYSRYSRILEFNDCKNCLLLEYLNAKLLILVMLLMKTRLNIIQNGNIFQNVHTEY